jgi:hypothetical protein
MKSFYEFVNFKPDAFCYEAIHNLCSIYTKNKRISIGANGLGTTSYKLTLDRTIALSRI